MAEAGVDATSLHAEYPAWGSAVTLNELHMFQVGGFFLPDGERHFADLRDKVAEYGKLDRDAAYKYVKRWRRALDIGANVGIFSRDFANRFVEVVAFEPVPSARECLTLNVPANVLIEPYAVLDKPGILKMYPTIENCGGSFICDHPQVVSGSRVQPTPDDMIEVPARSIDSYVFDAVDLIKLDIQGAEFLAIVGARETIKRHRPVILVETKPKSPAAGILVKKTSKLLRSWGMVGKEKAGSDRVFVFED